MKKTAVFLGLMLFASLFYVSCKREMSVPEVKEVRPVLPSVPYDYNERPTNQDVTGSGGGGGWGGGGSSLPNFNNNMVALGRVLFYDNVLSINNSVACATCHKQEIAFADNKAFSTGFSGKLTERNSMGIVNLHASNGFFWDMRTPDLHTMVLQPAQNHIEMGFEKVELIIEKMKNFEYYPDLFNKAYGSSEITESGIRSALTAFVQSMVSGSSKFDRVRVGMEQFTPEEQRGQLLFMTSDCQHCHTEPHFRATGTNTFANIGLESVYTDKGVDVTNFGMSSGEGYFKIPSLRNVAVTGPYMHDGRFNSLEDVVEHYNSGIKTHKDLHMVLKDKMGEARRLNLSKEDKKALVAFLKTLTDDKLTTHPMYSNPFRAVD